MDRLIYIQCLERISSTAWNQSFSGDPSGHPRLCQSL